MCFAYWSERGVAQALIAPRKGLISLDRAWQLVVMRNLNLVPLVPVKMTITGDVVGIAFEGT